MSQYSVELIADAEIELSDAFDWYNEKQSGLGNRFFNEVSSSLKRISDNPFKFAVKSENELRFAPLTIFPYLICYWIDEKLKTNFVISIFHTSQNPDKFK